ncbi:MAG: hypothetical protein KIT68_02905 [Phycisphaeraceae bacterium]|nr:hypothetical protein [Phycisphaeraceae bacterium]
MGLGNEPGEGVTSAGSQGPGGATTEPGLGVQREDLVRLYLSTRHVPCPACGYDLHGAVGGRCPECELPLRVELRGESTPRHLWLPVAALTGMVAMSLHWLVMAELWRLFEPNGRMALGFNAWTLDLVLMVVSMVFAGFGAFVGWRAMLAHPGASPYAGYFWCAVVLCVLGLNYVMQWIVREVQ